MQEAWVPSLGGEDPLVKGLATHSSILAWRLPNGQRSLVGCSLWGHKELDTTEWLSRAEQGILEKKWGGLPGPTLRDSDSLTVGF